MKTLRVGLFQGISESHQGKLSATEVGKTPPNISGS